MGSTSSKPKRVFRYDSGHTKKDLFYWFVEGSGTMQDKVDLVSAMQRYGLRFTKRASGHTFTVYANIDQMTKLFKECKSIQEAVELSTREFQAHS